MTTAELIQKREEEQKKPLQEQKPDLTGMEAKSNPADVTMRKVDNETNNKAMAQEAIAKNGNVPMPGEKVSLYDAGMNNPGPNNMKDARTSPITSPEYEKFRKEVIGAQQFGVETEEQRKKRERAEAIKQGLVGFTEGLSALANLYYTTKGAPSQKLTSQMPDLQKRLYEERLERDKKLEKFRDYIRGKADLEETRSYQEKLTAENRAYQDGIRKAQWEREDKIREQNQANLDRQFEYNATKDAEQTAYIRKRDEESDRKFWATHNENVRHNKAAEARSGEKGKGRLLRIQKPNGEPMVFQKDDLENIVNLSYIYNSLPDEYKVRDKSAIPEIKDGKSVYPVNDNPTKAEMQAAIGRALQSGVVEEIAESIQIGTSSTDNSKDKKKDNDDDVIIWEPSANNSNQANAVVGWKPQGGSLPASANDVQALLDKRDRRKSDMLQQGKDSLERDKKSLESDTFR